MLDDPSLVDAVAGDDGARLDGVVGADGQDRLLSLQFLNGALRHEQRLPPLGGAHADTHELPWQHRMVLIAKRRLHFEGAGLGVDAIQRVFDVTLNRRHAPVAQNQLDRQRFAPAGPEQR